MKISWNVEGGFGCEVDIGYNSCIVSCYLADCDVINQLDMPLMAVWQYTYR